MIKDIALGVFSLVYLAALVCATLGGLIRFYEWWGSWQIVAKVVSQ